MNTEEYISFILKAISLLGIIQIIFIILAGIFLWVIPHYVLQRAIKTAEKEGKQITERHYNSILPYPKDIPLTSKLTIIGSLICAFIMGIIAVVIGQP